MAQCLLILLHDGSGSRQLAVRVMEIASTHSLMQLRSAILAQNATLQRSATGMAVNDTPGGFSATIAQALEKVSETQKVAADMSASYEQGETSDIVGVMLARQKASIGFEATLQVRNRLLSAYRDIMSMPV